MPTRTHSPLIVRSLSRFLLTSYFKKPVKKWNLNTNLFSVRRTRSLLLSYSNTAIDPAKAKRNEFDYPVCSTSGYQRLQSYCSKPQLGFYHGGLRSNDMWTWQLAARNSFHFVVANMPPWTMDCVWSRSFAVWHNYTSFAYVMLHLNLMKLSFSKLTIFWFFYHSSVKCARNQWVDIGITSIDFCISNFQCHQL